MDDYLCVTMKFMLRLFLFSVAVAMVTGCEKEDNAAGTVDIYLIASYDSGEEGILIEDSSVQLPEKPVISYDELLSYNPDNYCLKLSDKAKSAIFEAEPSVYGKAFAVVANQEVVYTGYFWPGYFSQGCNWIVIDPLRLALGNEVIIELGYPGLLNRYEVPDHRNDERILRIFRRDHKLIE